MSKLPTRRRAWALAYGLTIVAAVPLLLVQQGWSSPMAGQREGVIHLKRGLETVDVDSLLDTNQPDFFLRIEMDKPSPAPSATGLAEASRSMPVAAEPSAAEPAAAEPAAVKAAPRAPEALPSPRPSADSYEAHLLDELEPSPAPSARPAPRRLKEAVADPAGTGPAQTQIVANALYHAPQLAREGRYQRALEMVDAALGVDDQVAPLHALRGSLSFKLGRERQAEEGWARALELDPRLTDAREALNWIRNRRR
jgi:tetratricopeptide (TPR) repeat protein